ncbi:MAG: hypothetical protein WAS55_02500 [Saprospiraceae bacterium]
MLRIAIFLLLGFQFLFLNTTKSQCTPPAAEECEWSSVLCSLDELNGYACNNPSTVPSSCNPLCSMGGVGHNTSWWGFVTQGGMITVTLNIGACTTNQGLQFGIWGDCNCGEEVACVSIPCVPPGSSTTIQATLVPCKNYYIWLDGCSGDICDFTFNTSGGGPPVLKPIGFINNLPSKLIDSICAGACNYPFYVDPQPGGCNPNYVWTLEGNEVGGNSNKLNLDFPNVGDFNICVSAFIGNTQSGSICSAEGPQCIKVKVRNFVEKTNQIRYVCWEVLNGNSTKDSSCVYKPDGTYRCEFVDSTCCKQIESGTYVVLDAPIPADVFYISCDNKAYIDPNGNAQAPCKDHFQINLPNTTEKYKCDSSILLTAINVDFAPNWRVQCSGGMVEISPNISILLPCNVGESYAFDYRWYNKNDINKKTISTDERLLVYSITQDYCVEVNVKVDLFGSFALCSKTFCETFKEEDLKPICYPLIGNTINCFEEPGIYWLDSFVHGTKPVLFTWTVDGGIITSRPDSNAVIVKWLLNPKDTGKICYFYETDCGISCEKCITISLPIFNAGRDFKKLGLTASLNAIPYKNSFWKLISGPANAFIYKQTDPKSKVKVSQYGYYCFEWSVNDSTCIFKDTVCADFFKIWIPPTKRLEDRTDSDFEFSMDQSNLLAHLFTPNLIRSTANSFIGFENIVESHSTIQYRWIDIYGKQIYQNAIYMEPGVQKYTLNSPKHTGLYFLIFEQGTDYVVRKICVIEN